MKYKVNQIFYSIQGEGYFAGTPAVFIRLSGCNLSCKFCDTNHSKYKEMNFAEIMKKVSKFKCRHIVLTGGEPTLQQIEGFFAAISEMDYIIHIETNGFRTFDTFACNTWITCSPKKQTNYKINTRANELKYIVGDEFEKGVICKGNYKIYLQPESNKKENIEKCVKLCKENPQWKLSLQLHKLINIK